jgi:hypothetical protein
MRIEETKESFNNFRCEIFDSNRSVKIGLNRLHINTMVDEMRRENLLGRFPFRIQGRGNLILE